MQLRIKLVSDTLPGTGAGSIGGLDQEVTHHPNGLPFLPARRLKGCLKEAALEVAEALSEAGQVDQWTDNMVRELFGEPGQRQSAWLRLSSAELPQHRQLGEWLEWLDSKTSGSGGGLSYFDSQAVLENYTTVRASTSLSRVTGGPVDNTLRINRVLKRNLEFVAQLDLIAPQKVEFSPAQMQFGLALACTAWRRMGTSRNRGLGEIKAVLEDNEGIDLSDIALSQLTVNLNLASTDHQGA